MIAMQFCTNTNPEKRYYSVIGAHTIYLLSVTGQPELNKMLTRLWTHTIRVDTDVDTNV